MSTWPGTDREPRSSAPSDLAENDATAIPKLGWIAVLKHAWHRTKASWITTLAGAIVTAILPVLIQWGDSYDFSRKGFEKVTSGEWIWSVVAVGAWLLLVALWHFLSAPMGHAREVLAAHQRRHEAEVERAREAAPRVVTNVREQHNYFQIGENASPSAVAAALQATPELLRQIEAVEPRPTAQGEAHERPGERGEHQASAERVDDRVDDADSGDSAQ